MLDIRQHVKVRAMQRNPENINIGVMREGFPGTMGGIKAGDAVLYRDADYETGTCIIERRVEGARTMTDEQETNHAFARSHSNVGLGGEKCFANMNFGFGNTNSWLEIKKYDDEIFFVRDADGVHAWHCGSLPITDRRILEIRTLPPNSQ